MKRWNRLRVSHYSGPVALTLLAINTIQMFVRNQIPLLVQAIVSLTTIVILIVCIFLLAYHSKRLCPECAVRLPLDCEGQAAKYNRRLRFIHALSDHKLFYWGGVLLLVLLCFNTGSIGFAAGLVLNLLGAYVILSVMKHSRLQPWCPWCKGKGEREEAPDLTPREPQFA
jgi:hypothetical protein